MTARCRQCALLALALCCAGITSASQEFDPHEPSGKVVQLTDENFDKLTDCELPWFIALTAPWYDSAPQMCRRSAPQCSCPRMWGST